MSEARRCVDLPGDRTDARGKRRGAGRTGKSRSVIRGYFLWALAPLAAIPLRMISRCNHKQPGLVLFMPRFGRSLNGNLKYLFLYMLEHCANESDPRIVVSDRDLYSELQGQDLPALLYPSLRSIAVILRAQVVVAESSLWGKRLKAPATAGAFKYQVWHGNGMKRVGMENWNTQRRLRNPLRRILNRLVERYPVYDVMTFSAPLQEETRGEAFQYREGLINGQPRNDLLFETWRAPVDVGCDQRVQQRIETAAAQGRPVVLYGPTWRPVEDLQPPEALDLDALDRFARRVGILLVYKAHPKEQVVVTEREHVVVMDRDADVYPALRHVDCMVTDYSSIYMDYLLLDRPVIFYPYDHDHYMTNRGLQHDYDRMTPGPMCFTQEELEQAIERVVVDGKDEWTEARRALTREFNTHVDGHSCERLVRDMRARAGF